MRRSVLTSLAAAAALITAGAAVIARGDSRDAGTGYQLENVEVLDPLMRLEDARKSMIRFNEALGVKCRDCHDLRNFASDEDQPLKLVARDMMKMEIEINERWFPDREENVVTCWTCHRGSRKPPASSGLESLLSELPELPELPPDAGAGAE